MNHTRQRSRRRIDMIQPSGGGRHEDAANLTDTVLREWARRPSTIGWGGKVFQTESRAFLADAREPF